MLGALSKPNKNFLKTQVRVQSGTAPESSRNKDEENHEYTHYRSQKDPHPKVGTAVQQVSSLSAFRH